MTKFLIAGYHGVFQHIELKQMRPLPIQSGLDEYRKQAEELLQQHLSGDPEIVKLFHHKHPRFLDEKIPWLPRDIPDSEILGGQLDMNDAELVVARFYDFKDWASLSRHLEQLKDPVVFRFEAAVDAVVNGDLDGLRAFLRADPELVRARSARVTHFDPPVHRSTLLHYVAANGVEGYRQKTPKNAVEIARALLEAGSEPDSLADLYGGECTRMTLLVSSCHPAQAGLQSALVDVLADFGASTDPVGSGKWKSPLMTALAFGYIDAAQTLVRRGARVENIAAAAGLGQTEQVRTLLPSSDRDSRQRALALAAQHGHEDCVRLMLDAGEDPSRYNPDGLHAHTTPLHQAIAAGHMNVVRLLVERGAGLDLTDKVYQSTPLGWATHFGREEIAQYLRAIR